MEDLSALQAVMVIAGPIILVIALIWAMRNNRVSKAQNDRTEQATRELYAEQNAEDQARDHR